MAWKPSSACLLLAALLVALLPAAELKRFEAAEPHMGTLFRITLFAADEMQAHRAIRKAFDRAAQLDQTLSDYKPDSEAMRLCREPLGRPVVVSEDLFTVLETARGLAMDTDGAFDVTIGPLTHLWRQRRVPADAELREARAHIGYGKVILNPAARTVQLTDGGMILDFGAIAKGYAADAALAVLRAEGITRALVAASGDLAIGDPPPGARGWQVGLDSFKSPPNGFSRVLMLHNVAVSTSGDTEQFLESGDKRYSHIIDPRRGAGLTERIGVSVLARRGIDADGLATALSVLGPERGFGIIERRADAAALFITASGERESSGFKSLGQ